MSNDLKHRGRLVFLASVIAAFVTVTSVSAQQGPPPIPGQGGSTTTTTTTTAPILNSRPTGPPLVIDQAESEVNSLAGGKYPDLNRNTSVTVGALQRAWDIPHASSGQTSPGIIRYAWHPNLVMAVRTREFMVTTINLPEWERLTNIIIGDPVVFEARQVKPNIFAIRPTNGGADTNITAMGASGNVYNFYIRSEGWNSDNISDFTVFVDKNNQTTASSVGGRAQPANPITDILNGGQQGMGDNMSPPAANGYGSLGDPGNGIFKSNGDGSSSIVAPDYIREIAFRPENLKFDMRILVSDPDSAEIAPVRVFHDGVWTYFDFGPKADSVRRPIVYLVVDGVDSMVNTRTAGPTGNILIAEAIGDFTLRNGNRVVCVMREETYARRHGQGFLGSYEQPTDTNFDTSKIQEVQRGTFTQN